MKVSILMAVYNGETYLEEALASVFHQTYQNIELVICNDGSTDSTRLILNGYHNREHLTVLHEAHAGMVHAFNRAFEACTGDAICFLAHDDVLPPDSIGARVAYLEQEAAPAMYCNGYKCGPDLHPISKFMNHPKAVTWNEDSVRISRGNVLGGSLLMIRRDIAEKVFPIPENLAFEDWWVVFNTLYHAGRIECLDRYLFLYRLHGSNDSGDPPVRNFDAFMRNHWAKHIDYYDQLLTRLNGFEIPDEEKEWLGGVMLTNREVVENTLAGRYTSPNLRRIRAMGLPKYLCSQLMVPKKAYLFYAIYDLFRKVTRIPGPL